LGDSPDDKLEALFVLVNNTGRGRKKSGRKRTETAKTHNKIDDS
jgi:hypothetical protein